MTQGELPPFAQMGTSKQGQQVELIANLIKKSVFLHLICAYVNL